MHTFITSTQWNWLTVERSISNASCKVKRTQPLETMHTRTHTTCHPVHGGVILMPPPTHTHNAEGICQLLLSFKSSMRILSRLLWAPVVPACLFSFRNKMHFYNTLCHHRYHCLHDYTPGAYISFRQLHFTHLNRCSHKNRNIKADGIWVCVALCVCVCMLVCAKNKERDRK